MKRRISLFILLFGLSGLIVCAEQSVLKTEIITADDLERLLAEKSSKFHLIDVRTPEEYAAGHIRGALNIPVDAIAASPLVPAAKDDTIIVYCRSGRRSARAKTILQEMGYANVHDFGAYTNWRGNLVTGHSPE